MADTSVTIVGNVTRDPELRFSKNGKAVLGFGVAVNSRRKNERGEWEDGDPQFFNIVAWGSLAENVADSVSKGTRVIVHGRLMYQTWETEGGEKRSTVRVAADEIGVALRWATAEVSRNEKRQSAAVADDFMPIDLDEEPF